MRAQCTLLAIFYIILCIVYKPKIIYYSLYLLLLNVKTLQYYIYIFLESSRRVDVMNTAAREQR
jgi:hypothetical protein